VTVHKIGDSVPRQENERLITGSGRFTDDLRFDDEAHMAVVRSVHANAVLRAVDCETARSMEGVIAVLTCRELKEDGIGALKPPFSVTSADGTPMFLPELLALVTDRVRSVGDPIAVVIAETRDIAEDAAECVLVDYEEHEAVSRPRAATLEGAPRIWDDLEDNIAFRIELGDEQARKAAFEVEIDPMTGATRITRYCVVDDFGTVINPMLLKGQIHGGVVQGAGQALMEDIVYEAGTGQQLTASFMDYAMPRADDFPDFTVESMPTPTKANAIGAKGAGEAGTVGALPAVISAICDALSPYGIHHIEMPATPMRVWQALKDAGAYD